MGTPCSPAAVSQTRISFNTFNTPQWNLPGSDLGGANFGPVIGAGGPRIMQFGLKVYW
jgi:hypothetical protein